MYSSLRLVIVAAIIGTVCYVLARTKHFNRKGLITALLVILALGSDLTLNHIPFENYFYTFPTVQKAFSYISPADDIIDSIEFGDSIAAISYSKRDKNTLSVTLLKRTPNGFKIGATGFSATKFQRCGANMILSSRNKNDEQTLVIVIPFGRHDAVSDSLNSEFKLIDKADSFKVFYTVVDSDTENYKVTVGNESSTVRLYW